MFFFGRKISKIPSNDKDFSLKKNQDNTLTVIKIVHNIHSLSGH